MSKGSSVTSTVIAEYEYSTDDLDAVLAKASRWAETMLSELERRFDDIYPWRAETL